MEGQMYSDGQGPSPSGHHAMSALSKQDEQHYLPRLTMQSSSSRPHSEEKRRNWSQHGEQEYCHVDEGLDHVASGPNHNASYTDPNPYRPPTPAGFVQTRRSSVYSDMVPPVQVTHPSSGPDQFGYARTRPEPRSEVHDYGARWQRSPLPQLDSHTNPEYREQPLQTPPVQYGPTVPPFDQQALQAKKEAILAAAHAYASTASSHSPLLPLDEAGYPVPPPAYYGNSAFPVHPGPYYYHHLHHHRHFHHYAPHYPAYQGHYPQPPLLQRQDSSTSSISRTSDASISSVTSLTQSTSAEVHTLPEEMVYKDGQHPLVPETAQRTLELEAAHAKDSEPRRPKSRGSARTENKEASSAPKLQATSAQSHHDALHVKPLQSEASHPSTLLRNHKVTRSSTRPYPSFASTRSTSSSSASSSRNVAPAPSVSQRTLRSSSVVTAKLAVESEVPAVSTGSRESKPRASKTAAVNNLAAENREPAAIDPPPTVEENILSLTDRPTKKSRGRRPVLSEELKLDNAEIQGSELSEASYAFAGDGRAMPVTKEQLEFAGTTKTGRPRMIFICQVPGCGKCFRRAEHLRRHLEGIHSDVKPHVCDVAECRRPFARRDNLKQHMKAVHGRMDVKHDDLDDRRSPAAMTAEDIEEMNAAFAGC